MREHAKKGFAAVGKGAKMLFGLGVLIVVAIVSGYAHQLFSFEECSPGTPSMTPSAIALAIFGATICDTRPAQKAR